MSEGGKVVSNFTREMMERGRNVLPVTGNDESFPLSLSMQYRTMPSRTVYGEREGKITDRFWRGKKIYSRE